MGTNLVLNGTTSFGTASSGKYPTNTTNDASNYGLAIGGQVLYNSGTASTLTNGNFRITNAAGTRVWYTNASNVAANTRLTTAAGAYTSTPALQSGHQQPVGSAVGSTGIDFTSAFADFEEFSIRISSWKTNNDTRLNHITLPAGNNPHILLVTGKINYINLTGAQLTALGTTNLQFDNRPTADRILVVNVDLSGAYTWTPPNLPGFTDSDGSFILWNFYTTTGLTINGTRSIAGTVFAPTADISFTNTNGVFGQLIGRSLAISGGTVRYNPFTTTLADLPEAIVLPLRSIELRGIRSGNSVELLWDVVDEVDIASYTVERSTNGTDFSRVGEVRSSGDHARYTYQFQDLQPGLASPTIFYRILVSENDGTRYYSRVKSLHNTVRPRWQQWPNPVVGELNLSFEATGTGRAQLRLINMAGQVVLRQDVMTRSGLNQLQVQQIGSLQPGAYYLEILNEQNERIGSSKVIK